MIAAWNDCRQIDRHRLYLLKYDISIWTGCFNRYRETVSEYKKESIQIHIQENRKGRKEEIMESFKTGKDINIDRIEILTGYTVKTGTCNTCILILMAVPYASHAGMNIPIRILQVFISVLMA